MIEIRLLAAQKRRRSRLPGIALSLPWIAVAQAQSGDAAAAAPADGGGGSWPLLLLAVAVLVGLVAWRRRKPAAPPPARGAGTAARREPNRPSAPGSVPARGPAPVTMPSPSATAPSAVSAAPGPAWTPAPAPSSPADAAHEEPSADFYAEVARLLLDELQKSPQRRDLRFKLMEVYAASGHRELFIEQTHRYLESFSGQADPYWPRIVRMGLEIAPDTGLYKETPTFKPSAAATAPPAAKTQVLGRRYYDGVNAMRLNAAQIGLQDAYKALREDRGFWQEVQQICERQIAASSPLQPAESLGSLFGGVQVYIKDGRRRVLAESAEVNAIAQTVIAKRMGKRRVVAGGHEEGHALAVARAAQQLGLGCTVYLHDAELRAGGTAAELEQLGASVMTVRDSILGIAAETQLQTLSDALDDIQQSLYICPLAAGPAPYPTIILDLQGLAGRLLRAQMKSRIGRLADALLVSTADGMQTVGHLQPFLGSGVSLHCVEAQQDQGRSSRERFAREHSWLRASERVRYVSVTPEVAQFVAHHAAPVDIGELHPAGGEVMAEAFRIARTLAPAQVLVVVIPADAAAAR